MRKERVVFLILAAVVCLLISCKNNNKNTARKSGKNTQIQINNSGSNQGPVLNYEVDFEPVIEFHGEAFPVKPLAIASRTTRFDGSPRMLQEDDYIGDAFGDFGVSLNIKSSSSTPLTVQIEIESPRFISKSNLEATIPLNKEIEIFPRIAYNYSELEHLLQPASENVMFRLYINNNLVKEKFEVVRFHSVNEVPLVEVSRRDSEETVDHRWLFAAYVNEDDPFIDKILREALEIGTVEKIGWGKGFTFGGYQGNAETVYQQVLAVWSVFQRHNIKYSNITTTSTGNKFIATQYVRTLRESFENSQANCVDGTILFASVLRKVGIEPFLVLVPGHMFIGYDLDEKGTEFDFLETTMLGNIPKATADDSMLGKLKNWSGMGKTQSSVARDSFLAATIAAREEWEEVKDKFDSDDDRYQFIYIADCRYLGIMPITRHE